MLDPFTMTPDSHPDSPARWASALQRALDNGLMIRPGMFGIALWTVTSKSRPDLCHGTDGVRCSCQASEFGDPVCCHRALYRAVNGTLGGPSDVPANVRFLVRRETPRPAA